MFTELNRRVLTALSVKNRNIFSTNVGKHLQADPLSFLDPKGVPNSRRVKIIKSSLLPIIKHEKPEVSIHLVEVILDYISTIMDAPVEPEVSSKPSVSVAPQVKNVSICKSNERKLSSSDDKPKQAKTRVEKSKNEIRMDVDPMQIQETGKPSAPVPKVTATTAEDTHKTVSYTPELPRTNKELKSLAKTIAKRKISGSVSPATLDNAKVLRLSPRDAQVGTPNKAEQTNICDGYANLIKNVIESEEFKSWLTLKPRHNGLRCDAPRIDGCLDCIRACLTAPVTDCEAVKCDDPSHAKSMFPHSTEDFDLNAQHNVDTDSIVKLTGRMANSEVLPSVFYTMMKRDGINKFKPKQTRLKLDQIAEALLHKWR